MKSFLKLFMLLLVIAVGAGVYYLVTVDIPAPTKLQVKELGSV